MSKLQGKVAFEQTLEKAQESAAGIWGGIFQAESSSSCHGPGGQRPAAFRKQEGGGRSWISVRKGRPRGLVQGRGAGFALGEVGRSRWVSESIVLGDRLRGHRRRSGRKLGDQYDLQARDMG